jgi:8-oxo-dGTP pyrophosphatase MutT (NUDIX family)
MANDTVLFENKWVTVKERELDNGIKWVFSHNGWCNGKGVAILPFKYVGDKSNARRFNDPQMRSEDMRYLGRVEICPSHSPDPTLCSVAGGMDKDGESPIEVAVRELAEETGYIARNKDMISLGECRPSKGTDTTMYLFAVDVTNLVLDKPTGDGTLIEQLASTKWINRNEVMFSKDPQLAMMLGRLEIFNG